MTLPLILGSISTCVIAFIASVGTNLTARRTAIAHLLFNVIRSSSVSSLRPFTAGLADRPTTPDCQRPYHF